MASNALAVLWLALTVIAGVVCTCKSICINGYTCLPTQQCFERHRVARSLESMVMFPCSAAPGYVCCPPVPKRVQDVAVDPEMNKHLLPLDNCGQLGESRISNGQEANLGQFPWMALLAYMPNKTTGVMQFLCGGTLINSRYILTAAHCLTHEKAGKPLSVRLGEHDLTTEEDCSELFCADKPVDIEIEKIIPHSKYNKPYLKNDIALLRLKEPVVPSRYRLPICLPFGLNITGEEEKKYTVAGWGKIENESTRGSDSLLFTTVPSAPVSDCNEVHSDEVKPINELQLCAGGVGGNDACKGDSGGPMMDTVREKNGRRSKSKTYQIGIVSFGSTPCGGEVPSVYTRVSSYLDWILTHLEP